MLGCLSIISHNAVCKLAIFLFQVVHHPTTTTTAPDDLPHGTSLLLDIISLQVGPHQQQPSFIRSVSIICRKDRHGQDITRVKSLALTNCCKKSCLCLVFKKLYRQDDIEHKEQFKCLVFRTEHITGQRTCDNLLPNCKSSSFLVIVKLLLIH